MFIEVKGLIIYKMTAVVLIEVKGLVLLIEVKGLVVLIEVKGCL